MGSSKILKMQIKENKNLPPTIFLSYSWENEKIADTIDNYFGVTDIPLTRDIRTIAYRGSIKDYMKSIATHDFAMVLISNDFLRSPNCMYEIMELMNGENYKEKILPILVEDKDKKYPKIFTPKDKAEIVGYWNNKKKEALKILRKADPTELKSVQENLKHYKNICEKIDVFLLYIEGSNCLKFDDIKGDYTPIFDLIGFTPNEAEKLNQLIKIINIEDEDDQGIAVDNFIEEHLHNYIGFFARGYISYERKKYKKSKNAYEKALKRNPESANAHNNYAALLIEYLDDKEGAKKHFLIAIEINPNHAAAHNNYALLLIQHFEDKEGAKKHYLIAIEIKPNYADIQKNYSS